MHPYPSQPRTRIAGGIRVNKVQIGSTDRLETQRMKRIEAYVRVNKLDDVKQALDDAGIHRRSTTRRGGAHWCIGCIARSTRAAARIEPTSAETADGGRRVRRSLPGRCGPPRFVEGDRRVPQARRDDGAALGAKRGTPGSSLFAFQGLRVSWGDRLLVGGAERRPERPGQRRRSSGRAAVASPGPELARSPHQVVTAFSHIQL